jgi:DNA topoisomerase IA
VDSPCQMAPAVFDQTVIELDAGRVGLRATGQVMRFAGYLWLARTPSASSDVMVALAAR